MKTARFLKMLTVAAMVAATLTSCEYSEDPSPADEVEQDFSFTDFDRLEMGDALSVEVVQGTEYSIHVKGDRKNMEDLVVKRSGSKLEVKFNSGWRPFRRHYTTYVTITMPSLVAADFSGAASTKISGFETDEFHLSLSGASTCELGINAENVELDLSGASTVTAKGTGNQMTADLSGASRLLAGEFPVQDAKLDLAGASKVKVKVSKTLNASASGASDVEYVGTPVLSVSATGSSRVHSAGSGN